MVITPAVRVLALTASLTCAAAAQTAAPAPSTPPADQPVFKAESRLVVLHVSVRDRSGRYITGLDKNAFTVIDDGQPQTLEMFSGDEVPASVGLLIDNSNSMGPVRERVVAASTAFAANSHRQDEVFVLTFNEHVRQAWPPTIIADTRPELFASTVGQAITARGMTAIYDGILEGLKIVRRGAHTRQVLILVSDGGDNASKSSVDEVLREVRDSDAAIYTVGLDDALTGDGNPRLLERLSRTTGGEAFTPRTLQEIPRALENIARDIRSAYTLAYVPTKGLGSTDDGRRRRTVRVYARSSDGRVLRIRTRDGYYSDATEVRP
jgi:Ca-activated chloride channel family protein